MHLANQIGSIKASSGTKRRFESFKGKKIGKIFMKLSYFVEHTNPIDPPIRL